MTAPSVTDLFATGADLLAATPTPTHIEGVTPPDPALVTPGTIGFLATLAVVVATIFLIRDAARRVRRIRANHGVEVRSRLPVSRDDRPSTEAPDAEASTDAEAHSTPARDAEAGAADRTSVDQGQGASGAEDDGTSTDR
ncbi:hypothetical protein [Brevibacterium litoralis]|uniref:hypothetical protein n=1 Tax=Brevibacterium litoralis TaxID=3138935 RepID=UPI0032EBBF3B